MDINKVIQTMEEITNDMYGNYFESFQESLIDISVQDDGKESCLRELHSNIAVALQLEIDKAYATIENHIKEVQRKRTEVERLEATREKLNVECETALIKKEKITKRLENTEKKQNDLESLKDCIKVYKLLTCTNFAYKKGSTRGYTKAPNSVNYDVFDWKISEINQEDITKKIWNLLGNISKKDIQTRTEHINKNNKKIILS